MRTLPIFLVFFVMGIADAMGPLAEAVRARYQLSNVIATLLNFFVLIAFALTVVERPERSSEISGLRCMATAGEA